MQSHWRHTNWRLYHILDRFRFWMLTELRTFTGNSLIGSSSCFFNHLLSDYHKIFVGNLHSCVPVRMIVSLLLDCQDFQITYSDYLASESCHWCWLWFFFFKASETLRTGHYCVNSYLVSQLECQEQRRPPGATSRDFRPFLVHFHTQAIFTEQDPGAL